MRKSGLGKASHYIICSHTIYRAEVEISLEENHGMIGVRRSAIYLSAVWSFVSLSLLSGPSPAFGAPVTITTAPTIVLAPDAPLARVLELTTNKPTRVKVEADDGAMHSWVKEFYQFSRVHAIPLFGFKPDRTYELTVTVFAGNGDALVAPDSLEVSTDPLPTNFPPIQVLASHPEKMEPGYTLVTMRNRTPGGQSYTMILDALGDVVWYSFVNAGDLRMLPNTHLFYLQGADETINELTLLGRKGSHMARVPVWRYASGRRHSC